LRRLKQWRTAIGSQHDGRFVDNREVLPYIVGTSGDGQCTCRASSSDGCGGFVESGAGEPRAFGSSTRGETQTGILTFPMKTENKKLLAEFRVQLESAFAIEPQAVSGHAIATTRCV
jgi:hypothetical protein